MRHAYHDNYLRVGFPAIIATELVVVIISASLARKAKLQPMEWIQVSSWNGAAES
jgi:hypothetical protein